MWECPIFADTRREGPQWFTDLLDDGVAFPLAVKMGLPPAFAADIRLPFWGKSEGNVSTTASYSYHIGVGDVDKDFQTAVNVITFHPDDAANLNARQFFQFSS